MSLDTIERVDQLGERLDTHVDGRRVAWRRFGHGPDLVLLHGGHGSWLHWLRNIEQLSASRTLWVPDMPGFGDSDALPDIDSDAQRMQSLVESLTESMLSVRDSDEPVDMAAFSFGALVAAPMASRGLVRRLSLLGPAGHGGRKPPRAPLIAGWHRKESADREAALRHNLATLMLAPANRDDLAIEVYERQCRMARFKVKTLVRTTSLWDMLAGFNGPLQVIWGEHDVTGIPAEAGPDIASRRVNTTWHAIEGSGHWVQYERADAVSSLLNRWFQDPPSNPAAGAA